MQELREGRKGISGRVMRKKNRTSSRKRYGNWLGFTKRGRSIDGNVPPLP